MEDYILSPDQNVKPIAERDGYRDYMLSDIAHSNNGHLSHIRLDESGEISAFVRHRYAFRRYVYQPIIRITCQRMIGISDARVRVQNNSDEIKWVSLFRNGEEVVKTGH